MCIIIAKKSGVDFPTEGQLENCFDNNSDGAGIMFKRYDEKHVNIVKGIMTFSNLKEVLESLKLTDLDSIVYHFRFATHGGKSMGNTHPFPLSESVEELQRLELQVDLGVCHNGIIPVKPSQPDISDTMEFIKSYLAVWKQEKTLFSEQIIKFIKEETGYSKYAFLSDKGVITLLGKGWINDKGLLFSNDGYKRAWAYTVGYTIKTDSDWKSKYKRGYTECKDSPDSKDSEYIKAWENEMREYYPELSDDEIIKKIEIESRIDEIEEILFMDEGGLTEAQKINFMAELDYYNYQLDMMENYKLY